MLRVFEMGTQLISVQHSTRNACNSSPEWCNADMRDVLLGCDFPTLYLLYFNTLKHEYIKSDSARCMVILLGYKDETVLNRLNLGRYGNDHNLRIVRSIPYFSAFPQF